MPKEKQLDLAKYRIQNAKEKLEAAELLITGGKYKDAVNRTYYAIFSAMRAVLALEGDGVDFKKHSGVISHFRKTYIKAGTFPVECSYMIDEAAVIRTKSDYNDFFIVNRKEAEYQYANACNFFEQIEKYVNSQLQV